MTKKEKFGRLVLLEEIDDGGLGTEYRAAKLGPAGLEKIVALLRLQPAVSANPEAAKSLMDQVKLAAQLQNPNVVKIFGIGKVEQSYFISSEYVEGRSLRLILDRCRKEAFPFSVEHALLVASKVCSALEHAHARRNEAGARYFHGLLTPAAILVSYEGEVRVRGFGYWPSRVRETGALRPEELQYLAPEQAEGSGSPSSDLYALGAMLLETLAGVVPEPGVHLSSRVPAARLRNPTGDDDAIPASIAEILHRSLARDPEARYPEVSEMRKAIDTLLFSGDFTPTTFNLAFFMHSLYRDDIEREVRALKEEREASYLDYLADEPAPASPATVPFTVPAPAPRTEPPAPRKPSPNPSESLPPAAGTPAPAPRPVSPDPTTGPSAREAVPPFALQRTEAPRNRAPLLAGAAALALVGGGLAWYLLLRPPPPAPAPVQAPPPALSPEALAAQARVKELEQRLAELEAEKAAAEVRAADDAKKKMEAQAKARGQDVDAAALQKAQEEARRRAKEEQERKQLEEMRRLEEARKSEEARLAEERRKAEEQARLAEEKRRAEEQARLAQAAAPAPAPAPVASGPAAAAASPLPEQASPPPTSSAAGGLRPGTLVNLSDPGVIPPVPVRTPALEYPPIAQRQRVTGTVELNVLIDEKGTVTDAQVVTGVGGKAGLNEAAMENVKRRRYRPATKDGVPVKVWMSVRVKFELPK